MILTEETLHALLDQARWAPSGDNTQPWRFKVIDDHCIHLYGSDTVPHCVYDFEGRPSRLAHGALIETLATAAATQSLDVHWHPLTSTQPGETTVYEIRLSQHVSAALPPGTDLLYDERIRLAPFITQRSVNRRALPQTPLTTDERRQLEEKAAPFRIHWIDDSFSGRLRFARLLYDSAEIRLTIPEAFETHRNVIEWNCRHSNDRMPDQSIGLDPLTTRLMRWAMQDWRRIRFLNRWLGGTILPRIQLDLLPGLGCAGHFILYDPDEKADPADPRYSWAAAGQAMQRVWLGAAAQKLQLQPEMTPLIFSWYIKAGRPFSQDTSAWTKAQAISCRLGGMIGENRLQRTVFIARIGHERPQQSRSLRQSLSQLLLGGPGIHAQNP